MTIERLSLLIGEESNRGRFQGVCFSSSLAVTHILFVDDVVLFGSGMWKDGQFSSQLYSYFDRP